MAERLPADSPLHRDTLLIAGQLAREPPAERGEPGDHGPGEVEGEPHHGLTDLRGLAVGGGGDLEAIGPVGERRPSSQAGDEGEIIRRGRRTDHTRGGGEVVV